MMSLKIGIIGVGVRGASLSFLINKYFKKQLKIVALCDLIEEKSNKVKKEINDIKINIYKNAKSLVNNEKLDGLIITSHTDQHYKHAKLAAEKKIKSILDKPISVSLKHAKEIVELEKRNKFQFLMSFTRRYETSWIKAWDLIYNKKLIGDVYLIKLNSIVPYTRYFQTWHRYNKFSGGGINDKCSHHVDVLRWFANSEVVSLSSFGSRHSHFTSKKNKNIRCKDCYEKCNYRRYDALGDARENLKKFKNNYSSLNDKRQIDDHCVWADGSDILSHFTCNFDFENEVIGNINFSCFGPASEDQETLEVVGIKGKLKLIRSTGIIELTYDNGKKFKRIDAKDNYHQTSHFGADIRLLKSYINYLKNGKSEVSAENGIKSLKIIDMINKSIAKKGKLIENKIKKY